MPDIYKFGWLPDGGTESRYEYPNVWTVEKTSGPDRLVLAPRHSQIKLIKELAACMEEPFLLLYVLVISSATNNELGRYKSKYSFTQIQLEEFLDSFSDFLQQDARHNLWIRSQSGEALVVYDRHNVIYAYGPLDNFTVVAKTNGLAESNEIRFPDPHAHHYHSELNAEEIRVFTTEEWIISPLRDGDENPT